MTKTKRKRPRRKPNMRSIFINGNALYRIDGKLVGNPNRKGIWVEVKESAKVERVR